MCKPHGNHKARTYSRYLKDKESKHITGESYHIAGREQKKKEKNDLKKSEKIFKMAISPYLLIMTLKVNEYIIQLKDT